MSHRVLEDACVLKVQIQLLNPWGQWEIWIISVNSLNDVLTSFTLYSLQDQQQIPKLVFRRNWEQIYTNLDNYTGKKSVLIQSPLL